MKKILIGLGSVLGLILLAFAGLLIFLSVTEFRPEPREPAETITDRDGKFTGDTVRVLSFNTGYGGLSDNADFFMDGGSGVQSCDEAKVRENVDAIAAFIRETGADFTLLQEVDLDSKRTYGINEAEIYAGEEYTSRFAANYRCPFVPIPLPPIGRVDSGLLTLTPYALGESERIALPCPFSWPMSTANLKRCVLQSRIPLENGRELVVVNLHLEAYDDGAGKEAQTDLLLGLLQEEYEKGNYVIAGGDFNQTFPGTLERYPILNDALWTPGVLEEDRMPEGWRFLWNDGTPTCRLLNRPYDRSDPATQFYVIDGFIVSPNVEAVSVRSIDLDFVHSDHNPVLLEARLK